MGIVGDLLEAIPSYTGLSPVAFFTLLAVLVGVYYLYSSLTAVPEPPFVPMEPPPPPAQLGDVTEEELKAYDGTDPTKPLLMAIKGQIYDVTYSRGFYGPGGPYALFAGRDASRALAKMSFEEQDLTGNLEGLGAYELEALSDWEFKFMSKYVKVGQIAKQNRDGEGEHVKEVEVTEGKAVEESSENVENKE
ncbi:hypothetical protein O6H91_10G051300 [Diphasiastrum complanatum]|uniref:Uncharacterized protein n=1 Tax=Diphasiastrum complanatum TaxID=34168 RepID=A0ACC2CGV7_DIPCM|nr:hypothetical protein O6H91_10G051300 [Diphasiastrum complanatum]